MNFDEALKEMTALGPFEKFTGSWNSLPDAQIQWLLDSNPNQDPSRPLVDQTYVPMLYRRNIDLSTVLPQYGTVPYCNRTVLKPYRTVTVQYCNRTVL